MIQGACEPKFAEVGEQFERNFADRGELGASVCVTVGGKTVVDLWGGVADPDTGRMWTEDTIGIVWSSTKGATALCAHMLADRGLLDLDAPVRIYWPEFGTNGKESISVRMLLNHQAGLAVLPGPIGSGGFLNWDATVDALASAAPVWEPGTRHGYHAVTFGHLVGEVIRRVSGCTVGEFFASEVAAPLGVDFWIGLPETEEPRVAPILAADPPGPDDPIPTFYRLAVEDPLSTPALLATGSPELMAPGAINTRAAHAAEIPAANGITNARGLAGIYRPLANGGESDGVKLISRDAIRAMQSVASAGAVDAVLQLSTRFTLGFFASVNNRRGRPGDRDSLIMSEAAFGHPGRGGSLGFADPSAAMSFGYTMNKEGPGILLNERGQSLVDAVYRSLGYHRDPSETWSP